MVFSNRKPCAIFQGEPLCETCPAYRNSKHPLGNFRTKTKRQFLTINTVFKKAYAHSADPFFPRFVLRFVPISVFLLLLSWAVLQVRSPGLVAFGPFQQSSGSAAHFHANLATYRQVYRGSGCYRGSGGCTPWRCVSTMLCFQNEYCQRRGCPEHGFRCKI